MFSLNFDRSSALILLSHGASLPHWIIPTTAYRSFKNPNPNFLCSLLPRFAHAASLVTSIVNGISPVKLLPLSRIQRLASQKPKENEENEGKLVQSFTNPVYINFNEQQNAQLNPLVAFIKSRTFLIPFSLKHFFRVKNPISFTFVHLSQLPDRSYTYIILIIVIFVLNFLSLWVD